MPIDGEIVTPDGVPTQKFLAFLSAIDDQVGANAAAVIDNAAAVAANAAGIAAALAAIAANSDLITALQAQVLPTGSIVPYPVNSIPANYLVCDGSSISRTAYAALFAVLGTTYGNVDANTFNLPDLRGEFLRGVDSSAGNDPDAASRTDRGDGTTGDNVGTKQGNQIQSHTHNTRVAPVGGANNNAQGTGQTGTVATDPAGGNETRPRNVSVIFCIKIN